MAGGINDPDDLVVAAFKAFDEEGGFIEKTTFKPLTESKTSF
jgi:hypothetical protein